MRRKAFIPIITILTSCFLLLSNVPGAGMEASAGVRMTNTTVGDLQDLNIPFETLIDYGSFIWGVLPTASLSQLDQKNIQYHIIPAPYTLSLPEGLVDPLSAASTFSLDQPLGSRSDEPGLYLLQFHGPTKEEWLDALDSLGIETLQYLHPFTYVVWGTPADLQRVLGQPFFRWAGAYQTIQSSQSQNRTADSTPILTRLVVVKGVDLPALRSDLESLGAEWLAQVEGADPTYNLVSVNLPTDQFETAAALPGIYSIQPLPLDGGNRGELGNQVNAGNLDGSGLAFPGYLDWLAALGLSGEGVIIANVDSGIDGDHPDLVNRMLPCSGLTCGGDLSSWHGTHTAGIMAGDGSAGITDSNGFLRGLGMSPGASLVEQVYEIVDDDPDRMEILMQDSVLNNAVISGNSWGPSGIAQGYDYDTRLVDIGVRDADPDTAGNQPLTYVLSIMNGGGGISTQGTPDEAKNIFTIGSTYLLDVSGNQRMNINDISSNSAHGPALDGRTIPHMVAPGSYVDSTYLNDQYAIASGTSMASPHVTGAVALFYEAYREQFAIDPSPALVKAAFLPVAHDLAGHLDADGEILGHPFDSQQGWGRLNASAVLEPTGEILYFDQETILDNTGETWSTSVTTTADLTELRAMLVWTDAPGHGNGGSAPAWVNDLDLSVKIGSQSYLGNQFGPDGFSVPGGSPDYMNNTEGIFLNELPPGDVTFTVTAANISGDGVPNIGDGTDQDFALVIYAYPSQDPAIDIEKSTNGEDADTPIGPIINVGDPVTWTYTIANTGFFPLSDVAVTDDQGVTPAYVSGDTNGDNILQTYETWVFEASGTAVEGQYANTGTVSANHNSTPVSDDDTSHYFGAATSEQVIEIEKSVWDGSVWLEADAPPGPTLTGDVDPVKFMFVVTNIGDADLENISLIDSDTNSLYSDQTYTSACNPTDPLPVGESFTCYTRLPWQEGQQINTASVTAQYNDESLAEKDDANYLGAITAINIEKSTNGQDADSQPGPCATVGNSVSWTYTVTNTGNVPLSNVTVTDDQGVTPIYVSGDANDDDILQTSEIWVFEASDIAVEGQYVNIGAVTADYNSSSVSDTDLSHYYGEINEITILFPIFYR
jgi:serine protease AprX